MHRVDKGKHAEERAAAFLMRAGYELCDPNYRCPLGELDLVAWRGDLVFVEVRSRANGTYGDATFAIRDTKQRQVARIAEHYLGERRPGFATSRFDVIAITGDLIELFRDAFRPGLKP